jgi:hypothetical protein
MKKVTVQEENDSLKWMADKLERILSLPKTESTLALNLFQTMLTNTVCGILAGEQLELMKRLEEQREILTHEAFYHFSKGFLGGLVSDLSKNLETAKDNCAFCEESLNLLLNGAETKTDTMESTEAQTQTDHN